jgi:RHS repeat-associated protein
MGSLATGMRDASGQLYMRNRYYDPQTGQFTQPDPIGLAGGLNSYGFAAGDPVTYSDPYGLSAESNCCPQWLVDGVAGFGDAASFGLTAFIRRRTPGGDGVNYGSGAYIAGAAGGTVAVTVATLGAGAEPATANTARSVANAAQSAAPRPGAAAALRARGQTFTGTSGARPVNPRVQQMLDDVPANQRSAFHGKCAEINCLSQAADAGVDVRGGTISVVRVRAPGNPSHGTPLPPCSSCAHVLQNSGVRAVP